MGTVRDQPSAAERYVRRRGFPRPGARRRPPVLTVGPGPAQLAAASGRAAADPIERLLEAVLEPVAAAAEPTGPQPAVGRVRTDPVLAPPPPPAELDSPGWLASTPSPAAAELDDEVEDLLRRIRLPHMRNAAPRLLSAASDMSWGPADVLRAFLREEADGRCRAAVAARRASARLPGGRTFDAWNPVLSSIPRSTQDELRRLRWVDRRENLVIWGPPGTGKSFFAEAVGHALLDAGRPVRWLSIEELGSLVRRYRGDGSITTRLDRVLRADLVVVDGIGLLPPDPDATEGLYRLVERAHEQRSLLVTSNLDPAQLASLVPDVGPAISDRLLHHAHVCRTTGGSLRHIRIDD